MNEDIHITTVYFGIFHWLLYLSIYTVYDGHVFNGNFSNIHAFINLFILYHAYHILLLNCVWLWLPSIFSYWYTEMDTIDWEWINDVNMIDSEIIDLLWPPSGANVSRNQDFFEESFVHIFCASMYIIYIYIYCSSGMVLLWMVIAALPLKCTNKNTIYIQDIHKIYTCSLQ